MNKLTRLYNKDDKFSIMDLLELYNMNNYLKDSLSFYYGNGKKHNIINHNNKLIGRNIPPISEFIKRAYNQIDSAKMIDYHYILWNFLVDFKYQKKYSNEIQKLIIVYSNKQSLIFPNSNKRLVNTFPKLFHDLLMQNSKNIEMLLQDNNVIRPNNFNRDDMNKLCEDYLNISDYNLKVIEDIIYSKEIVSPLKLKAQDIYDKDIESQLKNDMVFKNDSSVQFNLPESFDKLSSFTTKSNNLDILVNYNFNGEYILNHLDNLDIMDNFIFALHILDYNFLINSFTNQYYNHILPHSVEDNIYDYRYNNGHIDQSNFCNFVGYHNLLKNNEKDLMKVLNWFYTSYLAEEYDVHYFDNLNIEYNLDKYSDRCDNLVIQMHSVIKTYNLFSHDYNFDKRLIDYSNEVPKSFSQLNSLNKRKKYIYIKSHSKLNRYINLLFSDQTDCKRNNNYKINFLGINYSNVSIYKNDIDNMINDNILKINNKNKIAVKSSNKFFILYYYYINNVIPYYWIGNNFQKLINDLMKNCNEFEIGHTLLTQKESDYFDYFLNNFKYVNNIGLRNKYAHGSTNSFSNEKHKHNYLRILFLFLLLSIKINEELDYNKNHDNYKNYRKFLS